MRHIPNALVLIALVLVTATCSGATSDDPATASSAATTASSVSQHAEGSTGVLAELPPGSRDGTGGANPRSADYWVAWSSCGANSRADEAAANGGAAAGWFLVDDFLDDPGLAIGDFPIRSCPGALPVLTPAAENQYDTLASLLLAAEMNLSSGAENCPAAEQSVRAAHLALAGLDYAGPLTIRVEAGASTHQLIDLLAAYNSGDLCR